MKTKKAKITLITLILVVAIAVGAYFLFKSMKEKPTVDFSKLPQVQKTNVDFSQAPEKFPTTIPIENGARITQNYNAASPDGKFQATRAFETTLSLDENYNLYTDFLKKDGWQIDGTTNNPTYKMISATKGLQTLLISIDENKVNKIKTVSISYTESN